MRRMLCSILAAALLSLALSAQQLANDYRQILRPQLTRQSTVEDAAFSSGPMRFTLLEGKLALGAPIRGRETVAVFSGNGVLHVAPANPIEAHQIALAHPGSEPLTVTFTRAIFRFGDGAAFLRQLPDVRFTPQTPAPSMEAIVDERSQTIQDLGLRIGARALLALDASPNHWLMADLRTGSHGWVQARFDPFDSEAVEVHRDYESPSFDDAVVDDVWTHFDPSAQPANQPWLVPSAPPPYALANYDINLAIPGNLDAQVVTRVQVIPAVRLGGLLLHLDSDMRVTQASLSVANGPEQPLQFLQPHDPGLYPNRLYRGDWLYLRLPESLAPGTVARLTLHYHGKHLVTRVGEGVYFADNNAWYPSDPFGPVLQRADFKLHFQVNHNDTVVATGTRISVQRKGNLDFTDWSTPQPIAVAGFAFGEYDPFKKKITLPDGQKVQLDLMVNQHAGDELAALNLAVDNSNPLYTPAVGRFDPKAQAPQAMAQIGSAVKFMSLYFGRYPYAGLDVTEIPGNYGQGWPGLLYLSSLSFLDTTQLDALGVPAATLTQLTDTFRAHEVSHQWWGQKVGWETYHDQWLSEGLANGSALLFQDAADGRNAAVDTLKQWKTALERKNRLGHVVDSLGPLWLGQRLDSAQGANAYQTITYDKGGYVFWMLREMMLDSRQKNPDIHFIHMMTDFATTYAGREATTADFEKIVEKHMRPAMDLDGNHSMNWFFREYVYGTGIANLGFKAQVAPQGKGARVTFTVSNPDHWTGLLPIYLWKGKAVLRAQLALRGRDEVTTVTLGFRPTKIVANQYDDMLIDVKQ